MYAYLLNFISIGLLCRRKDAKNPNYTIFHSAMAPPSVAETKLNTGAQLQTFPFPMTPISFPYPNAFMAKWLSQILLSKSVTDKNLELFRPLAASNVQAPPNLAR